MCRVIWERKKRGYQNYKWGTKKKDVMVQRSIQKLLWCVRIVIGEMVVVELKENYNGELIMGGV